MVEIRYEGHVVGGGAIFEEKAVKVRNQYNPRVLFEEFSNGGGGGLGLVQLWLKILLYERIAIVNILETIGWP